MYIEWWRVVVSVGGDRWGVGMVACAAVIFVAGRGIDDGTIEGGVSCVGGD